MMQSTLETSEFQEYGVSSWVFAGEGYPRFLRVILRSLAITLWTLGCYVGMRAVHLTTVGNPPRRKRWAKKLSRRWVATMRGLFGIRVFGVGKIPQPPFFLTINHHTWVGYFGINDLIDARIVIMNRAASFPFSGILMQGTDPIVTDRKRENVPVINRELIATIQRKESILIAPEGAVTPGYMIRRYHAALLETAVATGTPVHYSTVHWRTPEGCRPPSQSVIYGPDPYVRDASGRLAASEFDVWGPERPLLAHLIHLLALPHCDMVIRFGLDPIIGEDRVSLAKALHAASLEIFTPSV